MGPDSDSYYDGSRMLLGITEYSGIPIDLVSQGLLQYLRAFGGSGGFSVL